MQATQPRQRFVAPERKCGWRKLGTRCCSKPPLKTAPLRTPVLSRQIWYCFLSGAAVGPLCDSFHSSHDVLHYNNPLLLPVPLRGGPLETCWWVPVLFGVAGVILGVSHPLLDEYTETRNITRITKPKGGTHPSWGFVLMCITLFVVQYNLSGRLEQTLLGERFLGVIPEMDLLLFVYAIVHFAVFEQTLQGLGMALLTAVCGPGLEICLINYLGLYSYAHPDIAGIPSWIPWVYFCGSPAVGNLGRRFWDELNTKHRDV